MSSIAFLDRSYRIAPDGRSVVCDALIGSEAGIALGEALAWRRAEIGRRELDEAEAVLELRALMTVDDMLGAARETGADDAWLTFTRDQARLLCTIAGAYVAERDTDAYQVPEERARIALLRTLGGPLMDLCCEFAAAEDEAREHLATA